MVWDRAGLALTSTDGNGLSHIFGVDRNGGFSEKVVVPVRALVIPLPDQVSFAEAAVAPDSLQLCITLLSSKQMLTSKQLLLWV